MARVCKTLIPEQGHPHRDHRAKKSRNWRTKVQLKKKKAFKEKIELRKERELAREEAILHHRYKHGNKI